MKEFQPYFYRSEEARLPTVTNIFMASTIFLYGIWSWASDNISIAVMSSILGILIYMIKPLKNALKKK